MSMAEKRLCMPRDVIESGCARERRETNRAKRKTIMCLIYKDIYGSAGYRFT